MSYKSVVGIDIGGTHITAALVDLETKAVLPHTRARAIVDAHGTVHEVLQAWCAVIRSSLDTHATADVKLGVSIPGPFDYEKGICLFKDQSKYECLYGVNVKELLKEQLNVKTENIKLVNDASCFLRGEVFGGAAKNVSSAIGLTLGTGLGAATLLGGVAKDADLWHAPFKDGIAEEYLSTRAFIQAYKKMTGKLVADVKQLSDLSLSDAAAKKVFFAVGKDLALFLAPYLQEIKPEVVVVGGNIANAWDLFIPTTVKLLDEMGLDVPIRKAVLAEDAALIGAASYWHDMLADAEPVQI